MSEVVDGALAAMDSLAGEQEGFLSVRAGNNDRVYGEDTPDGRCIVWQYHDTAIVRLYPDVHAVKVWTEGWHTATTKERIAAALRHFCDESLYQKNWVWYTGRNGKKFFVDGGLYPMRD